MNEARSGGHEQGMLMLFTPLQLLREPMGLVSALIRV